MGKVTDSPLTLYYTAIVIIRTPTSFTASPSAGIVWLSFVCSYEDSRDHIISHESLNLGGCDQ